MLKPGCNLPRPLELVLVGIGPSVGQLLADGDGFLDRCRCLLPPPQLAQPDRQVVQGPGQLGPERVRVGRGQLPVACRRLPRLRLAPPPAARARPAGPRGCSATWPGGAGTCPGRTPPAPGRRRRLPRSRLARLLPPPSLPSWTARVYSECARSGRDSSRWAGPAPEYRRLEHMVMRVIWISAPSTGSRIVSCAGHTGSVMSK